MKNKIFILILLTLVLIYLVYLVYSMPLDKEKIPIKFYLAEKTGFDLTTSQLHFGAITPNHSSIRTIIIENKYNRKIKITIESSGEISHNIIISENNFQLEPSESKTITFTVFTEGLDEFREYNGEVTIITKRI